MDKRLQELIELTKTKYGLHNYYLKSHIINRDVNIFNETVYTFHMNWFRDHVTEQEDDISNPEGTASIEINLNNCRFKSVIFVKGKSYAEDGVTFANLHTEDIINWVERETGLTYGKQFQIQKEEEGNLHFKECIDGIDVSPSGSIEVKFDQEGRLTFFNVNGQFPTTDMIIKETYNLTFGKVEHVAEQQLKLTEFPSYQQKKMFPVYAVEEIYVMNDRTSTIPYEFIVDVRSFLPINKTLNWDQSIHPSFDRKKLNWIEDITVEQAFSLEPAADSYPISKVEQEKCVKAVNDLLRQEYPNESGNWILKTLHRDKGYIHAILRMNKQDHRIFQRKLMIMIDANNLQAVNYIDNKSMLDIYDQFQSPDKVAITKEEAYEKLKEFYELKPYYVYDFNQKKYVLCGKLDCQYGVIASNGEVAELRNL